MGIRHSPAVSAGQARKRKSVSEENIQSWEDQAEQLFAQVCACMSLFESKGGHKHVNSSWA